MIRKRGLIWFLAALSAVCLAVIIHGHGLDAVPEQDLSEFSESSVIISQHNQHHEATLTDASILSPASISIMFMRRFVPIAFSLSRGIRANARSHPRSISSVGTSSDCFIHISTADAVRSRHHTVSRPHAITMSLR